jgi:hypothetical protein
MEAAQLLDRPEQHRTSARGQPRIVDRDKADFFKRRADDHPVEDRGGPLTGKEIEIKLLQGGVPQAVASSRRLEQAPRLEADFA